jgi:hypothetical protein
MNTDKQKNKSILGISRTLFLSTVITIGVVTGLTGFLLMEKPEAKTNIAEIIVYKSPTCNCCKKWISHLRDAGFEVTGKDRHDMSNIKSDLGVERNLQSCHTAIVDGYVIEGHVPANDIKRLLLERPEVIGLTVPGMPRGSPGMESQHTDPYDVLTFSKNGQTKVYASY